MIGHLELGDFPLNTEQCERALQALAKQIHARYTSFFTLLLLMPEASWFGQKLHQFLIDDRAHPLLASIGLKDHTLEDGRKVKLLVNPPSFHIIDHKKLVIFAGWGNWSDLYNVTRMFGRAASREIATFVCPQTGVPDWVNPDYICFTVPDDLVVSGLGLGYTSPEASGGMLVTATVRAKEDSPDGILNHDQRGEVPSDQR